MMVVRLRPRLQAVADRIEGAACAADVGCDHGRLCAWLLQNNRTARAIGVDVSAASLQKAEALRARCALGTVWDLRVGDGLWALQAGEADVLVFCGMGGELIVRLLCERPDIARAAERILMQPMGGTAELREYLYTHGYAIFDEALTLDAGRYYQLIAARNGAPAPFPPGFPPDMYTFGPLLFTGQDPLLLPLLTQYRDAHQRRLAKAQSRGRTPTALCKILKDTDTLIALAQTYKGGTP